MITVRMDSAYYNAAVTGAIRSQGARFLRHRPAELQRPRRHPGGPGRSRRRRGGEITARLIVRRVRDQNKKVETGQGELFPSGADRS
jgi:hypothetical protein